MTDRTAGEGRASAGSSRELLVRLASAVALAIVALAGAVVGGWAAAAVVAAVVIVVHLEWSAMSEGALMPGGVMTAALVAALAVFTLGYPGIALAIAAVAVVAAAVTGGQVWRPFGVFYAAVLGFGLLAIRLSGAMGLDGVLFLLAVVWATDTGAFFVGRGLGGPKLWPQVSPKKTWSGALGGLVAGVAAGAIVLSVAGLPVTVIALIIAGALAVVSVLGDLFESAVKRRFGTKDSGWLIPGHGGLLDRVDGLIAAAGLAALIGWAHAGVSVGQGLLVW